MGGSSLPHPLESQSPTQIFQTSLLAGDRALIVLGLALCVPSASVSSVFMVLRYDSVCNLTCSKKLTGSQLSLPHGINKKLKCETNNKMMSMIGPVQSHCHEGSPVFKRSPRWEGIVEKVGFEPGVKE